MVFTKKLRNRVKSGEITSSVRIWRRPRVKVGGRYPLDAGEIIVTSIREISMEAITADMAKQSGFEGVIDLLNTAVHGPGRRVFLVEFCYRDRKRNSTPQRRRVR